MNENIVFRGESVSEFDEIGCYEIRNTYGIEAAVTIQPQSPLSL